MANILRGYGLAREQGYFKQEQEADVQRHRARLIKEGKLPADAPKDDQAAPVAAAAGQQQQQRRQGFNESEHNYEVEVSVLQQQARLDDPHALRRKQYDRRIKGEPAPPSEADLLRARSKMYALGAAVGHVPRMSFGRNRYSVPQSEAGGGGGDLVAAGFRQLTPEAKEVASRTYVAGVRALVYGSLLGAIGLAAAATYAVRSLDIKSGDDVAERMRSGLVPLSAGLRSWLVPLKERAQAWLGPSPQEAAGAVVAAAEGGGGGGDGSSGDGSSGDSSSGAQAGGMDALAGGGSSSASAIGGGSSSATAELSRRLAQKFATKKAANAGGEL